jgi:hypothetical protein
MHKKLPDWLYHSMSIALLGEIYPSIRAIAIRPSSGNATLRYYLDREPTEFDVESIEVVATNLDACMSERLWDRIDTECVFYLGGFSELENCELLFYARREYDLE